MHFKILSDKINIGTSRIPIIFVELALHLIGHIVLAFSWSPHKRYNIFLLQILRPLFMFFSRFWGIFFPCFFKKQEYNTVLFFFFAIKEKLSFPNKRSRKRRSSKCTKTDFHSHCFQRSRKQQGVGRTAERVTGIIFLHTHSCLMEG